jgi:hypothetical protein
MSQFNLPMNNYLPTEWATQGSFHLKLGISLQAVVMNNQISKWRLRGCVQQN